MYLKVIVLISAKEIFKFELFHFLLTTPNIINLTCFAVDKILAFIIVRAHNFPFSNFRLKTQENCEKIQNSEKD